MRSIRKRYALPLAAVPLAAGAFGLVWVRYRREIKRQRRRISRGSRVVQTLCGPIEYADVGSGPPILVVHGAGGGYDQGLLLGAPFAEKGFRVIAMSRFGYLRTPLPADASAAAQADAHACLLDAVDIPRAAILGVSAGAPSAVQFVLRHPDRASALILLVPGIYTPRPGGEPSVKARAGARFLFETALRSDFLFWVAIRLARPLVTRAILGTPPEVVRDADAAERARVSELMGEILPVTRRRDGLINDTTVISTLARYDLERIAVPTLVISVADDLYGTFDGARYTAAHVAGAKFKGYSSGGHVFVGHQEEILTEVAAFLESADREDEKSAGREALDPVLKEGAIPGSPA